MSAPRRTGKHRPAPRGERTRDRTSLKRAVAAVLLALAVLALALAERLARTPAHPAATPEARDGAGR